MQGVEAAGGVATPPAANPDPWPDRNDRADVRFTPAIKERILAALASNHFMADAASLAGVHVDTVRRWIRAGRLDFENGLDTPHAEFYIKTEQASSTGAAKALKVVHDSAVLGNVQAAQWLLERRHGDKGWRKTDRVEIGGGEPVVIQLTWPGQTQLENDRAERALPQAPQPVNDVVDAEVIEDSAVEGG